MAEADAAKSQASSAGGELEVRVAALEASLAAKTEELEGVKTEGKQYTDDLSGKLQAAEAAAAAAKAEAESLKAEAESLKAAAASGAGESESKLAALEAQLTAKGEEIEATKAAGKQSLERG